jgi:hypothetical protein
LFFALSRLIRQDDIAESCGVLGQSKAVDSCVNNGADCGVAAATAFCKYIGFDGAVPGTFQTAEADVPTRSMTGGS